MSSTTRFARECVCFRRNSVCGEANALADTISSNNVNVCIEHNSIVSKNLCGHSSDTLIHYWNDESFSHGNMNVGMPIIHTIYLSMMRCYRHRVMCVCVCV